MTRIVVLSGGLLAALVASYMTWTAEDGGGATDDDEVVVYAAGESDLQKIALSSEELDVTVERRSDERGDYIWVESVERKEIVVEPEEPVEEPEGDDEAADEDDDADGAQDDAEAVDGDDDGEEEEEEPETRIEETRRAFKGNDSADELWTSFAPLTALRELDASGVDGDIFEFDEPSGQIQVTRRSGTVDLTLGGETYGSKDRYVRNDATVYLVDDAKLRPLLFAAQRLVERRLQPLGESDIERVEVAAEGVSGSFVQKNADDRAKAFWARADTPDTADENVSLWLGKVFELRLTDYATDVDAATLSAAFQVRVAGADEEWTIDVLKSADGTWYARSDFDRALVELTQSLANEIYADLTEILAE